jgi:hypothetical protein
MVAMMTLGAGPRRLAGCCPILGALPLEVCRAADAELLALLAEALAAQPERFGADWLSPSGQIEEMRQPTRPDQRCPTCRCRGCRAARSPLPGQAENDELLACAPSPNALGAASGPCRASIHALRSRLSSPSRAALSFRYCASSARVN